MRKAKTFCRMCGGFCGLDVDIESDRVVAIRGDKEHPATRGFACIKGLNAHEIHNRPDRVLRPLKRVGSDFVEVSLDDALDEIADRLRVIRDRDGPQAVATYAGTGTLGSSTAARMRKGMEAAIGCQAFSTATIDQSCKWVVTDRMGRWAAGKHPFELSDVWLIVGINPLVSIWGWTLPVQNPLKEIKAAKARGTKLIVIDPRRTEIAHFADIHLQINPGEDAAVAAGLLNVVFAKGLEDAGFCAENATGLAELREAVAPFTPEVVAARAGIDPAQLAAAAELFARAPRAGVETGTGNSMAPFGNLSEHLYEALGVVCGQFPREGDPLGNQPVTFAPLSGRAQAVPPARSYEKHPRTRVRGAARLMGETPVGTIVEEIETPGPGQVRALVVAGANPVSCVPDSLRVQEAFRSLELLVTVDPGMSATARISHFVIPPALMFERPELTLAVDRLTVGSGGSLPVPFAQYSPAVVPPPPGSDLVSDHELWWGLAARLGCAIDFDGWTLPTDRIPPERDLIAHLARNGSVPFEEIAAASGALAFDLPRPIAAAPDETAGRFELLAPDVQEEFQDMAASGAATAALAADWPFRLISRRMREALNSECRDLAAVRARVRFNPLAMHPDDLAALGLASGDHVRIVSDNGNIPGIVTADDTLKRGVVSMTHGFGPAPGEPEDYEQVGASTSLLISLDRDYDRLQAMPRMSAVPVRIERAPDPALAG